VYYDLFFSVPPRFSSDSLLDNSVWTKAGSVTSIVYEYNSNPPPRASLTFNSTNAYDQSRITFKIIDDKKALFEILATERVDEGEFVAKLENNVGKTTVTIKVIVPSKLKVNI